MKRLMTLLLAAGLVLGATSAAKAVDFKMTGLWQNRCLLYTSDAADEL